MNLWHLTPDTTRIPRRVSAGDVVHLEIGTWPIEPRHAGRVAAAWCTNRGVNSYWEATLGPFQRGCVITIPMANLVRQHPAVHL